MMMMQIMMSMNEKSGQGYTSQKQKQKGDTRGRLIEINK